MLLAEELLLLAVTSQDVSVMSRPMGSGAIDLGLAGAVLMELAMLDRVRLSERGESVGASRIMLRPGPPLAHPVLAIALDRLSRLQGRKPERTLPALSRGLLAHLGSGLVATGVLHVTWAYSRAGFLREWIVLTNPTPVIHIRGRVCSALMRTEMEERTAALIGFLSALGALTAVFDVYDQPAIWQWAEEIADHHWSTVAVRMAVEKIRRQSRGWPGFST